MLSAQSSHSKRFVQKFLVLLNNVWFLSQSSHSQWCQWCCSITECRNSIKLKNLVFLNRNYFLSRQCYWYLSQREGGSHHYQPVQQDGAAASPLAETQLNFNCALFQGSTVKHNEFNFLKVCQLAGLVAKAKGPWFPLSEFVQGDAFQILQWTNKD